MRFRRRRKARPLWFPPLGSAFTVGEDTTTTGLVTFKLQVALNGAIGFSEIPLTFDFGQEAELEDAAQTPGTKTLADLMVSAWRVRRVVGNVFATYQIPGATQGDAQQGAPPGCVLACGLMVRNVDEFGQPPGLNVDLLNRDDYTDPWIWRRVWVLGQSSTPTRDREGGVINFNNGNMTAIGGALNSAIDDNAVFGQFPHTNIAYTSPLTGPYIDAKTNRVIGPEQRLFLHFATKAMPILSQPYDVESAVVGVFDLRLLGNLQRSTNRRNASR